jgi:hypothetical protein
MDAPGRPTFNAPPRCAACGEVLGVYEPLVHVIDRSARRTSRAAEPDVCGAGSDCYHVVCYNGLPLDD